MNAEPLRIAALEAASRIYAGLASNAQAEPGALNDRSIKELAASLERYLWDGRTQ